MCACVFVPACKCVCVRACFFVQEVNGNENKLATFPSVVLKQWKHLSCLSLFSDTFYSTSEECMLKIYLGVQSYLLLICCTRLILFTVAGSFSLSQLTSGQRQNSHLTIITSLTSFENVGKVQFTPLDGGVFAIQYSVLISLFQKVVAWKWLAIKASCTVNVAGCTVATLALKGWRKKP